MLTLTINGESKEITLQEAINEVRNASFLKLDIGRFMFALPRGFNAYLMPGDYVIAFDGTLDEFKKLQKELIR